MIKPRIKNATIGIRLDIAALAIRSADGYLAGGYLPAGTSEADRLTESVKQLVRATYLLTDVACELTNLHNRLKHDLKYERNNQ